MCGVAKHLMATSTNFDGKALREWSHAPVILMGPRDGRVCSAVAEEICHLVIFVGCTSVPMHHVGPYGLPANTEWPARPHTHRKSMQRMRSLILRFPVQFLCGRVTFRPRLPCHSIVRSCGGLVRSCGEIVPQLRNRAKLLTLHTKSSRPSWSSVDAYAHRGCLWDAVSLCCWVSANKSNP